MNGNQEIQRLQNLLHRIARYAVENDGGEIDHDFCIPEIAAKRCPYGAGAYGEEHDFDVCAACLIRLFERAEER